jgi:tripartite-type tricarboxylate transporter receptor subunit TctC
MTRILGGCLLALAGAVRALAPTGAQAQSVEQFYRGRTLTMVISAGSGEGFDLNGRLVASGGERKRQRKNHRGPAP